MCRGTQKGEPPGGCPGSGGAMAEVCRQDMLYLHLAALPSEALSLVGVVREKLGEPDVRSAPDTRDAAELQVRHKTQRGEDCAATVRP